MPKSVFAIGSVIFGPLVVMALGGTYWLDTEPDDHDGHASRGFYVPAFSAEAEIGRAAFIEYCGDCHGPYGEGTAEGPPLVHPVYASDRLDLAAFRHAIRHGVKAYRWPFGDMMPVDDLPKRAEDRLYAFLREMHEANDID